MLVINRLLARKVESVGFEDLYSLEKIHNCVFCYFNVFLFYDFKQIFANKF
jgi:hypothetical protein